MSTLDPEYEISISDSEGEDYESSSPVNNGREAILFVVDANLCLKPELLKEAFDQIVGAVVSGLLLEHKDLMSLVVTNTENNPEPYEPIFLEEIVMPDNCAVFLPLRQLEVAIVNRFIGLLDISANSFLHTYGVVEGGEGNFSHMLRLCLDLVEHCNCSVENSTIVYMTNKEPPHSLQSEGFKQALLKAADLSGKQVDFQVIPMVDTFDYNVFYKEFMCLVRDIDLESFEPGDPAVLRAILSGRIMKQNFVRRSLGYFKLSIGPELELSAQYFNFYQKNKHPREILIRRADNATVHKKRLVQISKKDDITGELKDTRDINVTDTWYEINLGSSKIRISYEEVNGVRNLHSPGMKLLVFKPRSELSKAIYCKPCNFMYPDDDHIVDSKRLFRALWERCRARDIMAISLFMSKRMSMPRFVDLVPVAKDDANDDTVSKLLLNDGFKIVYLPSVPNIRNFDLNDWNSAENQVSDEIMPIFKNLVNKLSMDYSPIQLSDPHLVQLQCKMMALTFDRPFESRCGEYYPDTEHQDNRIAALMPQIEEIFRVHVEPAKKGSASSMTAKNRNAAKMPKLVACKLKDRDFVMQMIDNKTLGSCTKVQLLQILKNHFKRKVAVATRKADILEIMYLQQLKTATMIYNKNRIFLFTNKNY